VTNKREKIKREKKLSGGDTLYLDVRKKKMFFFFKKENKYIYIIVIICLIKTTGTEIVRYDDISNSITKKKNRIFISKKSFYLSYKTN